MSNVIQLLDLAITATAGIAKYQQVQQNIIQLLQKAEVEGRDVSDEELNEIKSRLESNRAEWDSLG